MHVSDEANRQKITVSTAEGALHNKNYTDPIILTSLLVDSLSIETFSARVGLPVEGYTQAIFNKYMNFVGKVCYSSRIISFVYEKLPTIYMEDLINELGEDFLEALLIAMIGKEDEQVLKAAIELLVSYLKLDQHLINEYKDLMIQEQTRCSGKGLLEKTFLLHIINKAINSLKGM
jgi:hypothetical protein